MPVSSALRSNLLRFVEDLLSYMTAEEKRGQLATAVLPSSADGQDVLDRDVLEALKAGRVGTVVGPRSRGEARQMQRIAIEQSRLGIPLIFAAPPDETEWPQPLAMAASWDPEAVEAVARDIARSAASRGIAWIASPLFSPSAARARRGSTGSSSYLGSQIREAILRGLSGEVSGADLDRADHVLALLRETDEAMHPHGRATRSPADQVRAIGGFFAGQDFTDWHHGADSRKPADLDEAVRRILLAKAQLGLFRDPFNRFSTSSSIDLEGSEQAAGALTAKAMVLLRNEDSLLPLGDGSDPILSVSCGEASSAPLGQALDRVGVQHRRLSGLALRQEGIGDPRALLQADGLAIGIASDAASRAQTVLLAVTDADCVADGKTRSAEGLPRLGPAAGSLLAALVNANPRCILVSATALPLDPASLPPRLAGHLHAWTPGAGFVGALGAILSGASAPSGRLPLAIGEPGGPHAYPFGHGLTYGTIAHATPVLEFGSDSLIAEVALSNSGQATVSELVQLYVRFPGEPTARLRDFVRIAIPPRSTGHARFQLGIEQLGRSQDGGPPRVAPGRYGVMIGKDRDRAQTGEADIPESLARAMSVPAALRDASLHGTRHSA